MRILHICTALGGGGVERVIYNYIKSWKYKEDKFFIVKHRKEEGILEKEFRKLGVTIQYIPPKGAGLKTYMKQMEAFIKENHIDVVHCHQGYTGFLPLLIAKRCHVEVRVAHTHVAFEHENILRKLYRKMYTHLTRRTATRLVACSDTAGKWSFKKGYTVLYNGIETASYAYDETMRTQVRAGFEDMVGRSLQNTKIIGCVSRIVPGKNHEFLLSIFQEILKLNEDALMVFTGEGSLRQKMTEKAEELGLADNVLFLGECSNVPELLNGFDAFVLPSQHEGLGLSLIEAQINGLYVVASKDVIPKEVDITKNIVRVSLKEKSEVWAKQILAGSRRQPELKEKKIIDTFDIAMHVEQLHNIYLRSYVKCPQSTVYRFVKRCTDILVALLALLVFIPVYIIVVPLIIAGDGHGPIFVHQRIGFKGKPIRIYKFRSMKVSTGSLEETLTKEQFEQYQKEFKIEDDARITKVGKFLRKTSLDELPQLINVLKGDLSLVGPRPIIEEEILLYEKEAGRLLSVKPGLTGYWQVYGRNKAKYETGERQQMELHYTDNSGFGIDLKVLFGTIAVIFKMTGV